MSRHYFRAITAAVLLFLASALWAQESDVPARPTAYSSAADIAYESAPNFFKLPAGLYFGEGAGVATNSKGHVFVFTRSGETRLFEFDQNGVFVREIGQGFYGFAFAHAVRVDPQDNIWTVDEGTNLIVKFSPAGKVLMVLGRRPESGNGRIYLTRDEETSRERPEPYQYGRPSDVAWDKDGNIFISDGYSNSRIVKYDKNGIFLKQVGTRGNSQLQFNQPHSIATDARGNVYVGDRANRRIQVLDNDLNFRAIINNVGAPWAICISGGPHQYLYSSNSNPDNNDSRFSAVTGEIYKMELDGTVLGKFGKTGKLPGEFSTAHSIDCRNNDQLFVGDIGSWRVQKITFHPRSESAKK